jgi:hypothetical protein
MGRLYFCFRAANACQHHPTYQTMDIEVLTRTNNEQTPTERLIRWCVWHREGTDQQYVLQ